MDAIHIIGAGGIGCAVGYALRANRVPVIFVENNGDKVAWGRRQGVCVDKLPAQSAGFEIFADWRPPARALVLLCTKCYDNREVLARLSSDAVIIPIQNGFDAELAARASAMEGIASFVSECMPGRTHTRITRAGKLHVGLRGHGSKQTPDDRIVCLLEALQTSRQFKLCIVDEIEPFKHTKLMYNAAISPLAAAAGIDNGQLLSVPVARRLFFELLKENYRILVDAGISLGKIGPFHPDTVQRILHTPLVARALAWAFYPSLRGSYCSMSGDLPAGRTEIDYYNRYLIDLAGDRPCPLNRRVYALIKRLEQDRVSPELGHLQGLAA